MSSPKPPTEVPEQWVELGAKAHDPVAFEATNGLGHQAFAEEDREARTAARNVASKVLTGALPAISQHYEQQVDEAARRVRYDLAKAQLLAGVSAELEAQAMDHMDGRAREHERANEAEEKLKRVEAERDELKDERIEETRLAVESANAVIRQEARGRDRAEKALKDYREALIGLLSWSEEQEAEHRRQSGHTGMHAERAFAYGTAAGRVRDLLAVLPTTPLPGGDGEQEKVGNEELTMIALALNNQGIEGVTPERGVELLIERLYAQRDVLLSEEAVRALAQTRHEAEHADRFDDFTWDALPPERQRIAMDHAKADLKAVIAAVSQSEQVEQCDGSGECERCGGRKEIERPAPHFGTEEDDWIPCPRCQPGGGEESGFKAEVREEITRLRESASEHCEEGAHVLTVAARRLAGILERAEGGQREASADPAPDPKGGEHGG